MATTTEKDYEALKADLSELRSDVSKLTDTMKKLYGDTTEEGRERVRHASERSRERARQTVGAFESEINERPLTSVAMALGVGFLIGKLLDR